MLCICQTLIVYPTTEQGLSTLYIHVHNSAVHGHLTVDATWVSTSGQLCKHTVFVNVCSRVEFSLEKKGEADDVCTQADVCTQGWTLKMSYKLR